MFPEEKRALSDAGIGDNTVAGRIFAFIARNIPYEKGYYVRVHVTVPSLAEQVKAAKRSVQYGLRDLEAAGLIERVPPEDISRTSPGICYLLTLRKPKPTPPSDVVDVDGFFDVGAYVDATPEERWRMYENYRRIQPRRSFTPV